MPSHRSKWGWWLVAALVAVLAASLLYRGCTDVPGTSALSVQPDLSAPADSSAEESAYLAAPAPVIRDTVYVTVKDKPIPVIREQQVDSGEPSPAAPEEAEEAVAVVETVIAIPVKDVSDLLRSKLGRDISLSTQAPDRISVKVNVPVIGEQSMDITAAFKVVEANDDRLVLQLDSGTAMELAADVLAPLVMDRLPAGLVESFSSGRAVINLNAVPKVKNHLSGLSLKGISVDESSIRLTVVEK